jgi:hypothetical protein
MKKLTLIIVAVVGLSMGVFAQGYIYMSDESLSSGAYISTNSALATSPSMWPAGGLAASSFTLTIWSAPTADSAVATTIDNADKTSGLTAMSDLITSGDFTSVFTESESVDLGTGPGEFQDVAASTIAGLTGGANSIIMVEASLTMPNTSTTWEGVVGGTQANGNSSSQPPSEAFLTGWDGLDQNLLLSAVPEPASLALAGLGGLSMLLFRRRNK